jgi:hypothetical protein
MPRYQLPPTPKGFRQPGSGRRKGQPNRVTIEARTLASQLVNDVNYQHKLRSDFARRRVHPTIEAMLWAYVIGKPTQPVAVAQVDVAARLADECQVFAALDVADLELLAGESQRLVDRARQLSRARSAGDARPAPDVIEPDPSEST